MSHALKCPTANNHLNIDDCNCDGYHTFDELYEHRIELFIALCKITQRWSDEDQRGALQDFDNPWRSKLHSDGSFLKGWFIMGIGNKEPGKQITYHLPLSRWDDVDFAETLEKAPEFDGHTSDDVINRLRDI